MRSWRSALETISYHNAYRLSSTYTPKNETERALQASIRDLELQCRERVDLLNALRDSRKDIQDQDSGECNNNNENDSNNNNNDNSGKDESLKGKDTTTTVVNPGWIGNGTIPAVDYADLSRPPPLRGTLANKDSRSQLSTTASNNNNNNNHDQHHRSSSPSAIGSGRMHSNSNSPRLSSPERRPQMLTTLRNGKKNSSSSASSARKKKDTTGSSSKTPTSSPAIALGPAASKAAGLAWDNLYRPTSLDKTSTNGQGTAAGSSSRYGVYGVASDPCLRQDEHSKITDDSRGPGLKHRGRVPRRSPEREKRHSSDANLLLSHVDANRRRDSSSSTLKDPFSPQQLDTSTYKSQAKLRSERQEPSSSSRSPAKVSTAGRRTKPTSTSTAAPSTPHKIKLFGTSKSPIDDSSGNMDVDAHLSEHARNVKITSAESKDYRPRHRETPTSSDQEDLSDNNSVDEARDNKEAEDDDDDDDDDGLANVLKHLPRGVDVASARQILNDIIIVGDEVHWDDIAGLETAKKALKEAVVYPFLRPDLFSGLREPTRGMLLFGPPGTGKTMLARAVATESQSTFFSVSTSTLTSKWHGDSEKLVRALFGLAKALAPSIIFVDEIDSLLSARSSGTENEASRRSKTEFLVQWSDLQRAAAGREKKGGGDSGDASRVLVLAATNMPWDIDEAARRRFVRRQYIPLPESYVREQQIRKLLGHQNYELSDEDIQKLVVATEGMIKTLKKERYHKLT